jgi:surface protein
VPELENNIIRECKLKETKVINCEIGDGDKCLTCSETENNKCNSCNPSYKLVNGKCILDKNEVVKITELKEDVKVTEAKEEIKITEIVDKENDEEEDLEYDYVSFTAKYSTPGENKQIPIIYSGKNSYIKKMKVNGILEDPKVSVDNNGTYLIKNSQNREHTMDIWLEINENILKDLFYCIHNLISIKFIKFKNSKNTKITSMENMFYNCTNLISIDISVIDTKDITNMHFAFIECNSLKTLDLSKNNFSNVRNAGGAFAYCNSLTSINLDTPFPNLESFDFGFYDVHSIKSLDISKMKPQKLKYMYCLFYDCTSLEYVNLNNFKTDLITDMHSVFYNCNKLTSVDLSQFNTKNVKDMQYMFYRCFSLTYLDLSSFDTSQVTNMIVMFHNCHSLTSINFGNTFNTSKVNDMSFMFDNCTSLTQLDLRQFNTKNVKNMQYMFRGCKKLKSVDISSFDTSLVTKFEHIFSYCSSLTSLDLSNFNFTECDKHSTGPPIMYYCESLKYIDITPISIIFRDFFTGIPNYGGKIRASRKLQIYLLQTGIRVLLNWDWEIVNN